MAGVPKSRAPEFDDYETNSARKSEAAFDSDTRMTILRKRGKRMANYDARALRVARLAQERTQPEFAILFGSRARGDHDEMASDIDVMLVTATAPGAAEQQATDREAQQAAQATYGRAVPVQLTWRTLAGFRHNRRYTNSVETNAMREGIVMPRHPENYQAADYEDAETEYEYDWTNYDNRMRHAASHLEALILTAEHGQNDLIIGQHAQSALEHGMKALLETHGVKYRNTHNIGELLGNIRCHDPELRDFRLAIAPDIYTEYGGEQKYHEGRRHPMLTEQADYLRRTVADAGRVISRAKALRDRNQANED